MSICTQPCMYWWCDLFFPGYKGHILGPLTRLSLHHLRWSHCLNLCCLYTHFGLWSCANKGAPIRFRHAVHFYCASLGTQIHQWQQLNADFVQDSPCSSIGMIVKQLYFFLTGMTKLDPVALVDFLQVWGRIALGEFSNAYHSRHLRSRASNRRNEKRASQNPRMKTKTAVSLLWHRLQGQVDFWTPFILKDIPCHRTGLPVNWLQRTPLLDSCHGNESRQVFHNLMYVRYPHVDEKQPAS